MGCKIEEIRPSFDVHSLGKVLWSMVSGSTFLRLWYFDDEEFDVERMFPDAPSIRLANPLFRKCIVQREQNCLRDANALLKDVDNVLSLIDKQADVLADDVQRSCRV